MDEEVKGRLCPMCLTFGTVVVDNRSAQLRVYCNRCDVVLQEMI
jgi:hypothetical protein